MITIIGLSLILIIIAFYIFLYVKTSFIKNIIFNTLLLISFSLHILFFVSYYFTGEGVNAAVLFHINYGLAGASFLEYWKLVLLTITAFIILFILLVYLFSKDRIYKYGKNLMYISFLLIILSVFINPASFNLYEIYNERNENIPFGHYYLNPEIKKINNSKNLVFIYAESLERTYFNERLFPGLITNLKKYENKSTYFTDIRQVAGTSWTIGGMVSSQLAIPLFTPINNKEMHEMDEFLPLAKGVGDLLKKENYYLSFYQGAKLKFQGKDIFYSSHGFDEIKGLEELIPKLKDTDNLNNWGLYDNTLLDIAYNRYLELAQNKEKFALYLITLGTHHPNGHIPKEYRNIQYKDGSNPILNAVKVTDIIISDFIDKILNSKYAEDTVIVVASDHLAMRNTAFDKLEKAPRRNLFMIISNEQNEKNPINKIGSTLDIGPTVLNYLGFDAQIGLGRNLLDKSISNYEIKQIHNNLIAWKEEIKSFWDE